MVSFCDVFWKSFSRQWQDFHLFKCRNNTNLARSLLTALQHKVDRAEFCRHMISSKAQCVEKKCSFCIFWRERSYPKSSKESLPEQRIFYV